MSDPTTDTLRRTMKAITEIAPEAPPIETVSDRSGRKFPVVSGGTPPRGWRGPATAFVAAVAVLVVLGVGALGTTWLRSTDSAPGATTTTTAAAASEGWVVLAFLDDNPDIDPGTMMDVLATQPGAIAVRFVTKAEALAEALEMFADNPAMVRVLEENPDLLPASIRILTDSQASSQSIAAAAAATAGVVWTDQYFGTLDEMPTPDPYEPPDVTSDTSTTTLDTRPIDVFLAEPLIQGPVVAFFSVDLDETQRDELVAMVLLESGAAAAGSSVRLTLEVVARQRLAQDFEALALLDEYPEIIEPLLWVTAADPDSDLQRVAAEFSAVSGVAAVQSAAGANPIARTDLPDDAVKLRSWWRAQMYRDVGLTWSDARNVADGELRAFLVGLTPAERDAAPLEQWRRIAQEVCTNTPLTTDLGMDGELLTAKLQEAVCRELIPWRLQPLD